MVLSYTVAIFDWKVACMNIRNLFSSDFYFTCIPDFKKSSMIYESFRLWVFRFGVSSYTTRNFTEINFQVLVIHDWVMHLTRTGNLLENRFPTHHISILIPSIDSLRFRNVIHLILSKFTSSVM